MRRTTTIAALILCLAGAGVGQEFAPSVRFLGDLRLRAEVDARDFDLSTRANTYTVLRTRFGLEASPAENIRVYVMARDSRSFGTEFDATGAFNTISDMKNLDLHQGYVEIGKFLSDGLTIRLGRQELSYSNERMIGAAQWSNIGRVFDGGLLRLGLDAVSVDLFGMNVAEVQTYPSAATPASTAYIPDNGQYFFGLYTQWKNLGSHKLDLYVLYQGRQLQTSSGFLDFQRVTGGGYAKGTLDAFLYEAEAAYQGGERGAADIAAYTLTGLVGYSFTGSPLAEVAAGYEYLSGTPAGEADYRAFDPPFATAHKFHGFMDYFTSIPSHTGGLGLTDVLGRVNFKISENLSAALWYHHFQLAQESAGENLLGDEIDVTAKFQYAKPLAFDVGVASFLPGPLMRSRFGGADVGLWGYVATTVTF